MSRHITPDKDKVPVVEKLFYGVGSGSYQLAGDGVKGLAYSVFNITLGLSPSLVGLVLMLSRLFDAFTDPLVGKWSDDTRTRFGRRRPFIFVGSFLTAMAFIIIWMVPTGWGHTGIFVYYLLAMFLFYLCATIQTIPYHTLGLELTADYHERTVVSAYKMLFSFVFMLFVPWTFRLAQADMFDSVMTGIRYLSWWIALAKSSLPVPLSPWSKTVARDGATCRTMSITFCIGSDSPMMFSSPNFLLSCCLSVLFSLSSVRNLSARAMRVSSSSICIRPLAR